MEAKKVRKGVGIRFASSSDVCWTCRQQSAYRRSLVSYFFLPTFPIPQSLWGSSGNLRMEVQSPGYRIRSFTWEEGGIGNDVSTKGDDQPVNFVVAPFLRISCGVSTVAKKEKRKKEKIPSRRELSALDRSSFFRKSKRFTAMNYIFFSLRGTIVLPKLIVVNWCARMKSFPFHDPHSITIS